MEKNIRTKVNVYTNNFKENLKGWLVGNNASIIINTSNGPVDKTNTFLQYMSDFPFLELEKIDFQKRKRIKNNVPDYNRCIALKCNGERCSRKQKNSDTLFCGTHMKGSPYGTVTQNNNEEKKEKIQLWLQEINGISRYIDNNKNVYCTEDILNSVETPRVIGKYGINDEEQYFIINS